MMHVVKHPRFGELERLSEVFTNDRGTTFVGGYWGPWRIYANLPADDLTVERVNGE